MSLLAEIKAAKTKHPTCGVAITLPTLSDEDQADFLEAVADPTVQSTTISSTLRKLRGVELSADTIQRHRRGGCRCDLPKV